MKNKITLTNLTEKQIQEINLWIRFNISGDCTGFIYPRINKSKQLSFDARTFSLVEVTNVYCKVCDRNGLELDGESRDWGEIIWNHIKAKHPELLT